MRKLLPVLLALVGLGAGGGAGFLLRPDPEAEMAAGACAPSGDGEHLAETPAAAEETTPPDYVKLNNQFVVPIVGEGEGRALVILSISLEVAAGGSEEVYAREPRLRDVFLQALFNHANMGGFDGAFTSAANMRTLRTALLEAAQSVLGKTVSDVLVIDIVRQNA